MQDYEMSLVYFDSDIVIPCSETGKKATLDIK